MSSIAEEEYFFQKDLERRRKVAQEASEKVEEEAKDRLRETHWMHCPKCGTTMETLTFRGVQIEQCFGCGGHFLDKTELAKLAGDGENFIERFLRMFHNE